MSIYKLFIIFLISFTTQNVFCRYSISGKTLDAKTGEPVEYASVALVEDELWAISNDKGEFLIKNVSAGERTVVVSCLGYAKRSFRLKVDKNLSGIVFRLQEDNLSLKEVTVTARRKEEGMTTSHLIDQRSLEHLQMLTVSDALSLLPGSQTNTNLHLATSTPQQIYLRSASGENGNPAFGTAIEVDGVRLSSNALFKNNDNTGITGSDTRNITSGNISTIEVVTGIPSVEYGDMTNGVVKINTRKGKSPWIVEMATKPNTRQISLNKGFSLGSRAGILNASAEYTKSISELASPYTSYDRNGVSLSYSNTFNKQNNQPISLETGVTGNIGGYDSHKDPDLAVDEYTKIKDNTLRANFRTSWLLNQAWITNIEASAAIVYTDNLRMDNTRNKDYSIPKAAVHGKEEGYFGSVPYEDNPNASVVLVPAGEWYQLKYEDSKPVNITANLKTKWARSFGRINNHLMLGIDFSRSGNQGKGVYYQDLHYTGDFWREYRYDQVPFMNNIALYAEEKVMVPVGKKQLQIAAGIRSDNTFIPHSIYGTVNSLSPRFNAKYKFWEKKNKFVKQMTLQAGWGKASKLPSFEILYPRPYFTDKRILGIRGVNNIPFEAYYIRPYATVYNPDLQWQYNQQTELGFEMKLKGLSVSLSFYDNKIMRAYTPSDSYTPFAYNKVLLEELKNIPISSANSKYGIDRYTGEITVSDVTGVLPDYKIPQSEEKTFKSNTTYINGSPATRRGLEWILDFDKIPALQTSIRIDGNYYYYRSTEETVMAHVMGSNMSSNVPYQYIGFYAGGFKSSNGYESKRLTSNMTFTTHIPAIRLIVSLRVEGTFYNSKQNLSEYMGNQRSIPLDGKGADFPAASGGSIYNTNRFAGVYPLYYVTYDDMETKIPFAEKLAWARDNDTKLYNDLSNMINKTSTDYYFNTNKVSGYYSANISVTKEIGNIASISFNASNFTNNMQLIRTSNNNVRQSIYESAYIPHFYYGLSLRLKIQ